MLDLVKEFRTDEQAERYTSWQGKECFRVFAPLTWYFLKCKQAGINAEQQSEFSFNAKGDGFEFEYCEGDCIIALDKVEG